MGKVNDSFTDTDSTDITAHVGEGGLTWTYHPTSLANCTIINNRLVKDAQSAASLAYASWVPNSPDYEISVDVFTPDRDTISNMGIVGRLDTTAATFYILRYRSSVSLWRIEKFVNNVQTILDTFSATFDANETHTCALRMTGPLLEAIIDGVARISVSDSDIIAAGRAGVRAGEPGGAALGWHLDNFQGFRARGDALIRRRIYPVFDDEEVNRFEFWPAIETPVSDAQHEALMLLSDI